MSNQSRNGSKDSTPTTTTSTDTKRSGSGRDDELEGTSGDDTLQGDDGDDTLSGGDSGDDTLSGGEGDDTLLADGGNDELLGGTGNDRLFIRNKGNAGHKTELIKADGGEGNDLFKVVLPTSATANVELTGGAGHDTFTIVGRTGGTITITDFQAGADGDVLDVAGGAGGKHGSDTGFHLEQRGADAVVLYDRDGASGAAASRDYIILKNVDIATLVADNLDGHALALPGAGDDTTDTGGHGHGRGRGKHLAGSEGDDDLAGEDGDDDLEGGAGDDHLHGGKGRDTASFSGKHGDYKVSRDASGWHVEDESGVDGADTLQEVERIEFADGALALDTDGVAGQAYRIYRAAFDRAPDSKGLGYWISEMDKGLSLRDVANGFAASAEFKALYNGTISNDELVSRLYQNVLHRTADKDGLAYWAKILDNKQDDVAGVLASISDSAENEDAVATLVGNGIEYTPWQG